MRRGRGQHNVRTQLKVLELQIGASRAAPQMPSWDHLPHHELLSWNPRSWLAVVLTLSGRAFSSPWCCHHSDLDCAEMFLLSVHSLCCISPRARLGGRHPASLHQHPFHHGPLEWLRVACLALTLLPPSQEACRTQPKI